MPVGITRLLTGGGDWRTLSRCANPSFAQRAIAVACAYRMPSWTAAAESCLSLRQGTAEREECMALLLVAVINNLLKTDLLNDTADSVQIRNAGRAV
ncbi:hypothetical protein KC316_g17 [Hortaea werneckii]|nr:hypothetical protein KC316_g17 [Hortaea werneckii]